jgi:hypothetical protein
MRPVEEVQQEVKALKFASVYATKKEINSLPDILHPDETIQGITSGLMDGNTWVVFCTSRRIIFLDKGLIYGLKQVETPLDKINSIVHRTGMFFGEVEIWDGSSKMLIKNCMKDTVKPFVEAVHHASETRRSQGHSQQPATDVASQLERLADLMSKGILTKEEFDQQKKKLLGV